MNIKRDTEQPRDIAKLSLGVKEYFPPSPWYIGHISLLYCGAVAERDGNQSMWQPPFPPSTFPPSPLPGKCVRGGPPGVFFI